LNLEDIIILADDGWDVKVKRYDKYCRSGLCCYDLLLILLFPRYCIDSKDFDTSIIHEFHHARYINMNETEVEEKSMLIVENHIEIVDYVKEIFEIKNWEDYLEILCGRPLYSEWK